MGKILKGILGGFNGKVGTVVGSSWRGIDVIRSLPKKSNRIPTDEQAIQRLKFALMINFLSPIAFLTRVYYGAEPTAKTKGNKALSYHLEEAVTGINPDFEVDFAKVILSKGDLLGLENAVVTPQATAEILFSWDDNSGQGLALATDKIVIAAYNEERKLWEVRDMAAARSALTYTLTFPDSWVGETVHCYVWFSATEKKKNGLSVYMGPQVLV